MKKIFKLFIPIIRKLGFDVIRFKHNQIGRIPTDDMALFLNHGEPIIFDVGANIGQSIKMFRSSFPHCNIHSFEPGPNSFETLHNNTSHLKKLHIYNLALGSISGQMRFFENEYSDMSSFLPIGKMGWGKVIKETLVDVKTIDEFCDAEKILQIDVLKLDTQGFDLEVLKGAEKTIQTNKIGLIYLEITFSEIYKNLPPFTQIFDFLESNGFNFVTFYKFHYQNNLAGWTNALFIHKSYNGHH